MPRSAERTPPRRPWRPFRMNPRSGQFLPRLLQPRLARPSPLADLANLASAAFDDIGRMTAPPAPITSAGAGGAVRVSMAQGRITGCAIDLPWLSRQDDTTLAHALREALSSAIATQSEADRPGADFSHRLNELLADVKATLHRIHRVHD